MIFFPVYQIQINKVRDCIAGFDWAVSGGQQSMGITQ